MGCGRSLPEIWGKETRNLKTPFGQLSESHIAKASASYHLEHERLITKVGQNVDSTARRLYGHGPRLWLPYTCHRYVQFISQKLEAGDLHMLMMLIASGLYYLSELVEEHTVIAKKLLTKLIYFVMGTQAFLCVVDGFPWTLSALSIFSHAVYLGNMRRFPIVKLTDPLFLVSCGMWSLRASRT